MLLILSNSGGFTSSIPTGISSLKWRLYITATINGNQPTIAEIEMRETLGGADACNGGTAIASSEWSSGERAALAFDNNLLTVWTANGADMADGNAWIEYQFTATVAIRQLQLTARNAYVEYSPKDFELQYWNGSAWVTVLTVINEPVWAPSEVRTYDVP